MRIVLVYQHFMVHGVGSTKPYDLARDLIAAGHDVTVLCGRGYLSQGVDVPKGLIRRLSVDGVRVICLGVDYRQEMGFVRRVAAFVSFAVLAMIVACRLRRYDVLVASSTPLTVGLVGLAAHYLRRIPYVFELRDLWPEFPIRAGYLKNPLIIRISTFFERWFYRKAAAILTISDWMRDRLIKRGIDAGKIIFIPTGVDYPSYRDATPDKQWRADLGMSGTMLAIYVGAHGPSNGLDYLLDAAELLDAADGIRMVLIGDGADKPHLMAEARRRKLESITFLPPERRSEVPGILKASDVALLIDKVVPGSEYGLPNKFFDYLAAGLPTISNTPAELWIYLKKHDCGVLVDSEQPRELADALRAFRDSPERAKQMGHNARELCEAQFDRKGLNRQLDALLDRVASQRRKVR